MEEVKDGISTTDSLRAQIVDAETGEVVGETGTEETTEEEKEKS